MGISRLNAKNVAKIRKRFNESDIDAICVGPDGVWLHVRTVSDHHYYLNRRTGEKVHDELATHWTSCSNVRDELVWDGER